MGGCVGGVTVTCRIPHGQVKAAGGSSALVLLMENNVPFQLQFLLHIMDDVLQHVG